MIKENVLLAGEESGGIATAGHIPRKMVIWMGLILFELQIFWIRRFNNMKFIK